MIRLAGLALAAYLIGSVPSAYLVARMARGSNPFRPGRDRTTPVNAIGAAGPLWIAGGVLLVDFLKGAGSVLLAGGGAGALAQSVAATAAVAGHAWPLWLWGAGGKGLATAAGAFSVVTPVCVPLWAVLWAIGYVSSGYLALGTLAASLLLPVALGLVAGWPFGLIVLPGCLVLLTGERGPVRRMLLGTEPKHYWRRDA